MQSTSFIYFILRILPVIVALLAQSAPAQTKGTPPVASSPPIAEMRSEDIFSRLAGRVLYLTCDLSADDETLASGVLVSADGFLVTNAHVVEGCRSLTAMYISGASRRPYGAVLKYYDKKSDTAVLKIEGQGFDFFNLIARTGHVGERVYAIGNPRGLEQSMSEGIVSGLRAEDGISWIQHSAPISQGSSGGALISSRGELLGINSWYGEGSQNLNFAVPASTLADAYRGARALRGFMRFPGLPPVSEAKVPLLAKPPLDYPAIPLPPPPSEQTNTAAQSQRLTLQQARERVLEIEKEISDTRASVPVLLPKDQFESSSDYRMRYQAWLDTAEPYLKPLRLKLEQFKQGFYLDSSVKPVFLNYDADAEVMTASTGGGCLFKIPKASNEKNVLFVE